MKKYIIDGYLGIMPLDLTNVEPKYHRIMINEHNKDITDVLIMLLCSNALIEKKIIFL